ncbi:MAG TPA: lipoate--protein ligase family protein [Chroococcales cyanobacterium]
MQIWRLIDLGINTAFENMAIDEALLEAHVLGLTPPTLRFYEWYPAALSIGYAQDSLDVDRDRCLHLGIDVVRRATGGKAVLHQGELTYSVVSSSRFGLKGSVKETYRTISEAIALGLHSLGIPASLEPGTLRSGQQAACFAAATPADLVCGGRKLVGSAQVRRGDAVLQHGSIPVDQDPRLLKLILGPGAPAPNNLGEFLERTPRREEIKEALIEGFRRRFGVEIIPCSLLPCEENFARKGNPSNRLLG